MNRVLFEGTALQVLRWDIPVDAWHPLYQLKLMRTVANGAHWTCSKVRPLPHQKLREDLATDFDLPSIATSV